MTREKYMHPILLKTTGAGSTIKDQTVISAAATKGGAPLIRWTKLHLAHVKQLAIFSRIFAVWSIFYCCADNLKIMHRNTVQLGTRYWVPDIGYQYTWHLKIHIRVAHLNIHDALNATCAHNMHTLLAPVSHFLEWSWNFRGFQPRFRNLSVVFIENR